jgi:hypothetical protein
MFPCVMISARGWPWVVTYSRATVCSGSAPTSRVIDARSHSWTGPRWDGDEGPLARGQRAETVTYRMGRPWLSQDSNETRGPGLGVQFLGRSLLLVGLTGWRCLRRVRCSLVTRERSEAFLTFLRELREQRRGVAFETGRDVPWLLFSDLPEQPTRKDESRVGHTLRRDMERALSVAGVPEFTPHSLRHTYASRLISDSVSPEYVRRQLGHANIGITLDLYGRSLPMAAPDGALGRLAAPILGAPRNESATNAVAGEGAATGTFGDSITSSPRPAPCPRSPCTCISPCPS